MAKSTRIKSAGPARSAPGKQPAQRPVARLMRGGFDAAQTTDENRRHWSYADALGPNAAANAQVRRMLRNRARYECANNSYAAGITTTVGNDTVGVGPRLQMQTDDDALNTAIETKFTAWSEEVGLGGILRTAEMANFHSGESFGLIRTNLGLDSPVKIDLNLVEPDQIPGFLNVQPGTDFFDGIEYDEWGNPKTYHVLNHHPGDILQLWNYSTLAVPIPAKYVLHFFRKDRPGQRRGIPRLTPALPLFANLRRYTLAVVAAAETAADFAAVIYSEAGADENAQPEPFDVVELEKRMATVMPAGYKLGQIRAEQPTSTYSDFVWTLLREIARCLSVPLTIAALDSSKANLSAAYLDHQTYAKSILITRREIDRHLNRLLDIWITEAASGKEIDISRVVDFKRAWFWPGIGNHADPDKVASAQVQSLATGTTNLAREYAKIGLDWQSEQETAAQTLGIPLDEYRRLLRNSIFKIQTMPVPADGSDPNQQGDQSDDSTKPDVPPKRSRQFADSETE